MLANLVLGAILAIMTGLVLMWSVQKIRKFYQENDLNEELNVKALTLHASAFGIYLLSTVVINISIAIVIVTNNAGI